MAQPFVPANDAQLAVIITPAVVLPFTALAVGMRFYSRFLTTKALSIDDWLIAFALVWLPTSSLPSGVS